MGSRVRCCCRVTRALTPKVATTGPSHEAGWFSITKLRNSISKSRRQLFSYQIISVLAFLKDPERSINFVNKLTFVLCHCWEHVTSDCFSDRRVIPSFFRLSYFAPNDGTTGLATLLFPQGRPFSKPCQVDIIPDNQSEELHAARLAKVQ